MATTLNTRLEQQNVFLATSQFAKVQTGFGVPMSNALLNWRENCVVSLSRSITREDVRDCAQVNLIAQKLRRRYGIFEFVFTNPSPQRIANYLALKEGTASAMTGSPANAVHTLTRSGTVSGGSFKVALDFEGRLGTTDPIAWNATAADIQSAIMKRQRPDSLGRLIAFGDVVVSGNWTSGIVLTFGGRFANAVLPLVTIDGALITGGGSVEAAETTAGAQRVCDITRSAGSAKRLFSFALGDLDGDIATDKYIDAAVNDVEFGLSDTNAPTMTVRGFCAYLPDEQVSFSVPSCVSGNELEAQQVKVIVDDVYEQRDLVSETITISDSIQPDGMFVADDIDITRPPRRGGRANPPTQNIALSVYGTKESRLAVLADSEEIGGNEVEVVTELGLPKQRVRIIAPEAKIQRTNNAPTFAGALSEQTVEVNAVPMAITGDSLVYEYYGSQTEQFLLTN